MNIAYVRLLLEGIENYSSNVDTEELGLNYVALLLAFNLQVLYSTLWRFGGAPACQNDVNLFYSRRNELSLIGYRLLSLWVEKAQNVSANVVAPVDAGLKLKIPAVVLSLQKRRNKGRPSLQEDSENVSPQSPWLLAVSSIQPFW